MKNGFKNAISNLVSILWFIGIVFPLILELFFIPFGLLIDMNTILTSGFASNTAGFSLFGALGIMASITMLVPCFRKCFKKLPWLYSYVVTLLLDILIIVVGIAILNYGYEVQSEARHRLFCILMIVQMVVCRIAMCMYFKMKPLKYMKE